MRTASFFTYTGPGRISIARFPPRGTPAGFRVFKPLAPGPWFNSVTREEYERRYAAQLAQLDARIVVGQLQDLAGAHEPVLLCWERPPFSVENWCHRRIVAGWFSVELGIDVPEHRPTETCGLEVDDWDTALRRAKAGNYEPLRSMLALGSVPPPRVLLGLAEFIGPPRDVRESTARRRASTMPSIESRTEIRLAAHALTGVVEDDYKRITRHLQRLAPGQQVTLEECLSYVRIVVKGGRAIGKLSAKAAYEKLAKLPWEESNGRSRRLHWTTIRDICEYRKAYADDPEAPAHWTFRNASNFKKLGLSPDYSIPT